MTYRITHKTRYVYDGPVNLCHNEARLRPRDTPRQTCSKSVMAVEPGPTAYRERVDFFGNHVCYFAIERPHEEMVVTVTSEVTVVDSPALPDTPPTPWESERDSIATSSEAPVLDSRAYVLDSSLAAASPELAAYAEQSFGPSRPFMEGALELMHRIHEDFEYVPGFTSISTPMDEVLKHRRGVCQDFAHVGGGCLRSLGLPARYCSGYIETLPPPGKEKLVGADASHAWYSAFAPDIGWIDFDPTNDRMAGGQHVAVAWGRDFSDVTPLKGVFFGSGENRMTVSVDVTNLKAEGG